MKRFFLTFAMLLLVALSDYLGNRRLRQVDLARSGISRVDMSESGHADDHGQDHHQRQSFLYVSVHSGSSESIVIA